MATFELDPLFIKALRLLHSKAKDSTEQLKQLLDEGLHHHTSPSIYGQESKDTLTSSKHSNYGSKKLSTKQALESSQPSSKKTSSKEDDIKRKEAEKRTFDKLKQEIDVVPEPKKSRIDSPKVIAIRSPSPAVIKDEDSSDDNTSATDIALEMGLACVVCRSFDVASGNTLVECQDCHSLYHQECHKPLITDQEVNDPRLVWYCAKCTKNMKKMASKNQKSVKPVTPATSTKDSSIAGKQIKPEPIAAPPVSTHIFKRAEPKITGAASSATSTVAGNKPIGLAGLAASLSGKSHQVQKTSQSSGGKSSTVTKPIATGTSAVKPSTVPSLSIGSKSSAFQNLLVATKASSQSGGGSTTTTAASNIPSTGSNFLPAKSSSASSLTTVSTSKTSLTASVGGNGSSTSASSSSASSTNLSSKSASSSSLMSADKRLQIMKKKAAAKMQEKRRLSSK